MNTIGLKSGLYFVLVGKDMGKVAVNTTVPQSSSSTHGMHGNAIPSVVAVNE